MTQSRAATVLLVALTLAHACAAPSAARPKPATPPSRELIARSYAARGDRYAREGDPVRAEQYLASAWRLDPSDAQVFRRLVLVCVAASHLRAALGHAESYLLRHPDAPPVRRLVTALRGALVAPQATEAAP
jgi:hypothetical protein